MVELNRDCEALVAAAGKLPRSTQVRERAATAAPPPSAMAPLQQAAVASIDADAAALSRLRHRIAHDARYPAALAVVVDTLVACSISGGGNSRGHVYVSGIGKSGAVAHRLAISLRSVGVRASSVAGGEWHHGDLGGLAAGDAVILLSNSGKAAELVDVARIAVRRGATAIAIADDAASPLAAACAPLILPTGLLDHGGGAGSEAPAVAPDLMGCIPSRSIVAQEAVGNVLVSLLAARLQLTPAAFRDNHPGGAIGAGKA